MALAPAAVAQTPAGAPTGASAPSPKLQAAMKKADAGDPVALVAMADAGDAGAQYYAGVMYIFGRGTIAKDAARGCAYERKASASRGDAMFLVGRCYQSGVVGAQDKAKAEAAYTRAAEMGFSKSKCALGQMLMAEPQRAEHGVALCKQAATAGDAEAQSVVGNAYFSGAAVKQDHAEARKWYEMAVKQQDLNAARRLGEMYARGDGGKKDPKKAMELWVAAEKAGDPMVAILVADQLFSSLTGRTPGPGTYKFKGGIPVADLEVVEEWYRQASKLDPRPDVKKRADYAVSILGGFKSAPKTAAPTRR